MHIPATSYPYSELWGRPQNLVVYFRMSSRGRTTQQSLPGVCSLQLSLFSLTVSICALVFWPSSLLRRLLEWLHCDYFCWSPVQGQLGCSQHGVRNSIPFRKASEGSLEKWPCELLSYFALFIFRDSNPWTWKIPGPWFWLQAFKHPGALIDTRYSFVACMQFQCKTFDWTQILWLQNIPSLNSVSINQHC